MDEKSIINDEMRKYLCENIRDVLIELILEQESPDELRKFAEDIVDAWTYTQKQLKVKFKNKKK